MASHKAANQATHHVQRPEQVGVLLGQHLQLLVLHLDGFMCTGLAAFLLRLDIGAAGGSHATVRGLRASTTRRCEQHAQQQ